MNKDNTRETFLKQDTSLSEEEQALIERDLQSPDYDYFKSDAEGFLIPKGYDADSTYTVVQQRIGRKRTTLIRYWGAAASIAILLSVFSWIQFDRNRIISIETGYGETKSITLPDGSEVLMNALSTIEYRKRFGKQERSVKFSGEARWEVAKDAERPFKVNSEHLQVEVLGTIFNLKDYPEDEIIETALLEGLVQLHYSNGKSEMLRPGQTEVFHKSTGINQTSEKEFPEWDKGILQFNQTPLKSILQTLTRQYRIEFLVPNDKGEVKITGNFRSSQDLKEILDVLKEASGFNYKQESNQIIIE